MVAILDAAQAYQLAVLPAFNEIAEMDDYRNAEGSSLIFRLASLTFLLTITPCTDLN